MHQRPLPARDETFLDNPEVYPEFRAFIGRQWLQHRVRLALHRNRTPALIALIAVSVGASCATPPALLSGGDRAEGSLSDLKAFLSHGLALPCLVNHFEGFGSAAACMLAMTLISLLVYPLHMWASPAPQPTKDINGSNDAASDVGKEEASRVTNRSLLLRILTVSLPALCCAAISFWGSARYRWGFASGMCVGMQCACFALKSVSFAQACSRALSVRISSTSNDSSSSKEVIATAPDPDGFIVVAGNSITDGDQYDPCKANMDSHKADIDPHSSTSPASSCSSGQGSHGRLVDGSSSRNPLLTFREFCFFLLLAPSLVLVPEWVKQASATTFTVEVKRPGACCRRRRIGRAACEFFHAALTYLAVHAMASGMYAPVMRVLATLFCDDASSFWLDAEAWSSYRTDGTLEGWLVALSGGAQGSRLQYWLAFTIAFSLGMLFSSMVHFLMFYAFWHCVCLGSAQLWNYPDRNFYGPWWLVTDDLKLLFRMWSAPVHRWLAACVHRPIVELGRRSNSHESGAASSISVKTDGPNKSKGENKWLSLVALTSAFALSGAIHEAVTFVAMRHTCWPFNTFALVLSGTHIALWDVVCPVRSVLRVATLSDPMAQKVAVDGRSHAAESLSDSRKSRDKLDKDAGASTALMGSEWRGWGAVVYFMGTSCPFGLMIDYLGWQWWRHTLLVAAD